MGRRWRPDPRRQVGQRLQPRRHTGRNFQLSYANPPRCGSPRNGPKSSGGARLTLVLDSSAKLRLIRHTAGGRMAEEEVILEAEGLTKEFAGFVAVKNVDLRVRRHTIHALIGPNGAGKTTCFNLLTHFLTPPRGEIRFNSRNITRSSPPAIARMRLARSFQRSAVFPHPSGRDNVRTA